MKGEPRGTKKNDLVGKRFGKLLALKIVGARREQALWLCQCDCGNAAEVPRGALLSGNTKSCGCGMGGTGHRKSKTRAYRVWQNMIRRCSNPKDWAYRWYGGRGISVCERWRDFTKFLEDMGQPPDGLEIDRINNNGNYEPGNCRWATIQEQMNNRRNTIRIEFQGCVDTISGWAIKLKMCRQTLRRRFENGWSVERALTTPTKNNGGATRRWRKHHAT